jgi:hypothetical protein
MSKKSKDEKISAPRSKKLKKAAAAAEKAAVESAEPAKPGNKKVKAPVPKRKPMAKKPPAGKASPVRRKVPAVHLSTEDISLRAYYIGERRHKMGWPGNSADDWLEAEAQLRAEAEAAARKRTK